MRESISEAATPDECGGRQLDGWLKAMAQGDRSALEALYRKTSSAVYGFALSICRNAQDAEDVLQDTYLQALRGAESYRSQGKPMAWLLTITRNLCLMRLRERNKAVPTDQWPTVCAPQDGCTPEDRILLEHAMTALGDQERQVVMLHAVAGMKHREIAAVLELPLPTVLSKYSRALKKLRNAMKEDE
ncbi:MAG: RNA polymerase sigma factor [Oscillospiraceae bacterium]|nr:RNA polymerase sigma factor [Oscillospiraceae bacterium]